MTRILIADDSPNTRASLMYLLEDAGYEVMEAADGGEAFDQACHGEPDVILLDVRMPVMNGFEVLRRLRENPSTASVPVIMLTGLSAAKGERASMSLSVTHYITKPLEPGMVESAIKVALREVGIATEEVTGDDAPNSPESQRVIRVGNPQMDKLLNGGIPLGSLTLIEGIPSSGKSVLCKHFTYESLLGGHGVAYFTSDDLGRGFISQMESLGRDVTNYFRAGQLAIYPIKEPTQGGNPGSGDDPGRFMPLLATEIERLPSQYKVVIADDITKLAGHSDPMAIGSFFTSCRSLCDDGKIIILAARSYAFDEKMLLRLEGFCDAHLSLGAEKMGAKLVKMLEVRKIRNTLLHTGNTVSFEVDKGSGLRVVPGSKVKI